MKTIKFLITATALAIVAIANAVERPKMEVTPITTDKAMISITNDNLAYFELSIETKQGDLVYYKQSSKPLTDYKSVFDFTKIGKGIYVLNLRVNDTKLTKKIHVADSGIFVGSDKLSFDPYFNFKDGVLKFSYLNFDKENLKLNVYGSEGLIYQTKLGNDFTISSGYDLSKLEAGNYKVILNSFNKEFEFQIEK